MPQTVNVNHPSKGESKVPVCMMSVQKLCNVERRGTKRHGCDAVTRVHLCPFRILQNAQWARGAHLVKYFPYHLNQVYQHILVRHNFLNRFHRYRHQLIDVTYTFLVILPSCRYCPYQQKVFIVCSLLQFSILNYGSQQTFERILDIIRGSIHDEGPEPQGAWNSLAGTNGVSQLIQSLGHMSVLSRKASEQAGVLAPKFIVSLDFEPV